jgi:hypothetical protein
MCGAGALRHEDHFVLVCLAVAPVETDYAGLFMPMPGSLHACLTSKPS